MGASLRGRTVETVKRGLIAGVAALLLTIAWTSQAQAATAEGVVINNGQVALGVTELGSLNYDCAGNADPVCLPASFEGTSEVGLRFLGDPDAGPGGLASTEPGCLCEGWGAADAGSGLSGWANEAGGNNNVTSESITSPSGDRGIAVVNIEDPAIPGATMKVTQDYHSTPVSPFIFINTVTITNTGSVGFTDLRYRRVMDWDAEPTAFDEYVTSKGTSAQLLFNSDDGFQDSDPLGPRTYIDSETVCGPGYTGVCEYTDLGNGGQFPAATPDDIGGLYDFGFGPLGAGESKTFSVLYGAAPSETEAIDALTRIGAQIYSLGQSSCEGPTIPTCSTGTEDAGPLQGKPATFFFAFNTAQTDLEIVKTGSDPRLIPDTPFTYTLTVNNKGPEDANGVTVSDALPAGLTLNSTTPSQGTCSGTATISCDLGTIPNGGSATVQVAVTPTAAAGSSVTNTATVASLTNDPNQANNSSSLVTPVGTVKSNCRGITVNGLLITGTDKNETLTGTPKSDQIRGGGGNDKMSGGDSADCLIAQSGNDTVKGDEGKDIIRAGSGRDNVKGGSGNDDIRAQDGNDKVAAGSGDDKVKLQGQGRDKANCGSGNDTVIGDSRDTIKPSCEKVKIVDRK